MKAQKYLAAAGIMLFVLAALFSISLLSVAFDFGELNPARSSFFYALGKMLTGVYGLTSICIPVFLIVAGLQTFMSKWRIRNGVLLLGSVIPFFTLDAIEHICRMLLSSETESVLMVKLASTLLIGALVLTAEYLLLSILGEVLENSFIESMEYNHPEYFDPQKPESAKDEDEILFFDDEGGSDGDSLPEEEKEDITKDALFLQQKEILKDLIDSEYGQEEISAEESPHDDEKTLADDSTFIEEPAIIEHEEFAAEAIPEPIAEEEILSQDDFIEPEIPDEPSPFEHIFDEQEKPGEEETVFSERQEFAQSEPILEPEPEENFSEPPQGNEISVNSEDFKSEYDEMNDVRPVEIIEEKKSEIRDDSDENEDFEETEFEEPFGVEDIFSQMEADAAENPVIKNHEAQQIQGAAPQTGEPIFEEEYSEEDPLSNEEIGNDDTIDDDTIDFENEEISEFDSEEYDDPELSEEEEDFAENEDEVLGQIERINDIDFDDEEIEAPDVVFSDEIEERSDEGSGNYRKMSEYKIPTDLLEKFENDEYWRIDDETNASGEELKRTLNEFGIEAEVTGIRKGPVVTMFELLPAPGVKLSKIVNLQDNIALSLAAKSVRIVAPIPGKHAVGIEIPNKERAIVSFREIIEQNPPEFKKMAVPVILGKDISGQSQIIDIAKTPHLLIAGATGAGKSVCVNSIILSILYNRSPKDVKLIMVDPKVVELKLYNDIPHLLTPVVTEPKRALQVLQYCLCEMERRYALLDGMGVRDIVSYNTRILERKIATEKLPYIIVIIDEFADLMATSGKELETNVARLTAMSRAVGIHLVLATQRPSVNVITGLIKANIPSRIAFMVASRTDSNIIIDSTGAEKLLGKGDMLYTSAVNPIPTRIQGTLVGDNEVERVVEYVKSFGEPDYIDDEIFIDEDEIDDSEPGLFGEGEDPLYDQALQIVIQAGKASASYIQRRLKIGYNRAARLVEEMEERGIVGPANGSKPREVIHMP